MAPHDPAPPSSQRLLDPLTQEWVLPVYDELLKQYMPPGLLVDQDNCVLQTFGSGWKLFQHASSQLGESLEAVLSAELLQTVRRALEEARSTGKKVRVAGNQAAGSSKSPLEFEISPIQLGVSEGKLWLILVRCSQPSEAVLSEAESLLAGSPTPNNRILKLERELRQIRESLQQTIDDLRASNGELENFAYVASHDLREPLRMITSYLSLIKKEYGEKLDETGHEFMDFAVDGAQRMKHLIDDLLTYSRLSARRHEPRDFPMEDAVSTALKNLAMRIEESNAMITINALPRVYGDEMRMAQLFQNLVGNALKFCSDEPPVIQINCEDQSHEWVVRVSDNGIGIPQEHHNKIFGIFQRLHGREAYEGTGIGLSVCEKIVHNHSGKIWVESEPGEGTTFFFSLPKEPPRKRPS
ncbi:MAG: ATP-binding protein [Opitutales bacterium]